MAYKPMPTKDDGTIKEVQTSDDDSMELLQSIFLELKIMNMHLSFLTGVELTQEDV